MWVEPGFSVTEPDPGRWELARNRMAGQEPVVVYREHRPGGGALSFRLLKVGQEAAQVPLEVLGEGYFVTAGLVQGIDAKLLWSTSVLVGDQPAVASVGQWTIRPLTLWVVQVMVRCPDGLAVITLSSPMDEVGSLAPELDRVLRNFSLATPTQVDPFLLDTIPFEDPDHDPGRFVP